MAVHIHLLHNSLSSFHSHPYGEAIAYIEALKAMGGTSTIYANTACDSRIVHDLKALPVFPYATDSMVDTNPTSAEQSEFVSLGNAFGSALANHLPKEFTPEEIIYIPYARQNEAHGVAIWLKTIPADKRPKIVLFCYRPEFRWSLNDDRTRFEGNFTYWRAVGSELIGQLDSKSILLASTDHRLSAALQAASGIKALTVKMPTLYPLDPAILLAQMRDIDVGLLGTYRPERGSQFLINIINLVDTMHPGLRYLVQVQNPSDFEQLKTTLNALRFQGNLEVLIGNPDQTEYIQHLSRFKLACLPYAPARYATRSSGVLSECAAYGIPMVIPANTWLSDRLDAGEISALKFEYWTPEAIATCIELALSNIGPMTERAKYLSPTWREQNNAQRVLEDIFSELKLGLEK
ncbi:glycosyltransferase family 4 protein [Polynucleobacter asymbioticus]|uniref:glycosyltransferase family 4 protein n=1 Tax=Polynucleobacter asymbioticus TaxID=576611 RepID=UPI000ADC41A8|nr:glycosyltransferase family 4 protein [Polynucleobacter asymbioticus]